MKQRQLAMIAATAVAHSRVSVGLSLTTAIS